MNRQNGFTLYEMLIGLVVMVVLILISVPMYQSTISSIRVRSTADELVSQFQTARLMALVRVGYSGVCGQLKNKRGVCNENWDESIFEYDAEADSDKSYLKFQMDVSPRVRVCPNEMERVIFNRNGLAFKKTGASDKIEKFTHPEAVLVYPAGCKPTQKLATSIDIDTNGAVGVTRGVMCPESCNVIR